MALPHARSGQLVDMRPLGTELPNAISRAILKTPNVELMRMVLQAGKSVPEHAVQGEITLFCLEGSIELSAHGTTQRMQAGDLMYLQGGEPHALKAIENASLLVTVLLSPGS
jgi:quercetin dioxygenase-like cupin family protein